MKKSLASMLVVLIFFPIQSICHAEDVEFLEENSEYSLEQKSTDSVEKKHCSKPTKESSISFVTVFAVFQILACVVSIVAIFLGIFYDNAFLKGATEMGEMMDKYIDELRKKNENEIERLLDIYAKDYNKCIEELSRERERCSLMEY